MQNQKRKKPLKMHKHITPSRQEQGAGWDIPLTVYGSEQDFLRGFYQGEEPACTCLFKRFARHPYAAALRMVRNQEEAEEIVQGSFLRACTRVRDFEQRSSLQTWLSRIVSNTALMHLRRKCPDTSSSEESQQEGGQVSHRRY